MVFSNKLFFILESLILFVLPQLLIRVYPPLIHYRLLVMGLGLIYVFFVAKYKGWNLTTLGFKADFSRLVLFISLVLALLLVLTYTFQPSLVFVAEVANEAQDFSPIWVVVFYVLVSVPLQEILFRGFYINRLKLISTKKCFLIIFSSFVFGFIHLPLANKLISMGSFFLSLWWAHLLLKHNSLFLPIISHALIGATFILLTLLQR